MSTIHDDAFHAADDAVAMDGRASLHARVLASLLRRMGGPPLRGRLWTGETVGPTTGAAGTLVFHNRNALYRVLLDPERRLGDVYSEGALTVDGDLVQVAEAVYESLHQVAFGSGWLQRLIESLRRRSANTLSGSRENIHRHYDLGNEFYSLWLGRTMAYTCAYYAAQASDLDAAQAAKMDHVCRKLWLRPGETVVEAGCGWGVFALHMARHFGVRVRAFNISTQQIAYARERAAREGLADRVEYVEDDYRNVTGRYDAFVSIGMLEHVGTGNYQALGDVIRRAIGPEGRALLHTIGRNRAAHMNPWIDARIFPGAHPPSLAEMAGIFEPHELSVLDVENLRLHYARTLRDWFAAYTRSEQQVRAMFDENFVRMWRLYLAGSIAAFEVGDLQLFQVLVAPRGNNAIPLTRDRLHGH